MKKCLVMQNYRLILRMIDEQSWILRNIIIWYKPNHMPESVKDRFTNAYEPVFMLTKSKKYWFDLDAVRMSYKEESKRRYRYSLDGSYIPGDAYPNEKREKPQNWNLNPLGKNPGDVWTIPTQPFPEAHFATFPEKLVEPMIKAGCPQWICRKCGKARERITERGDIISTGGSNKGKWAYSQDKNVQGWKMVAREHITVGWTDCGCNDGWDSGIVLDPFAGSGTTCLVAKKLGRHYIGIDLNPEYCKMARKRLNFGERLEKFGFEFV